MTIPAVVLTTPRLQLMPADPALAAAMLRYQESNRQHLARWDPPRPPGSDTEAYWQSWMAHRQKDHAEGRSASFLLALAGQPGEIIGTCNLSNFVRGVFQACHLGYGIAAAHEGQGLMGEAVAAVVTHAFTTLHLHRVQANYQPDNVRSAALLARLGFVIEGHARDYLFIDGAWRDHVLTARVNPDFDIARMLA